MIAANRPIQRASTARLLHADTRGNIVHAARSAFVDLLRVGDVIVANDAATLPASLPATHLATGETVELRLSGRDSLDPLDMQRFVAVLFGAGDYRTRTEDRAQPPAVRPGDRLQIGPITAVIDGLLDHPRFVRIRFEADAGCVWQTLAQVGRPIQYAHVSEPLQLWDVWTPLAALPVAYEAPSAGFMLDWQTLAAIRERGARLVTLTHAAGISSTGDSELDQRLPLDEPYVIPDGTADAINHALAIHDRVIAIGTTVVRALEHAAQTDGCVCAGDAVANQRLGPATQLRVVDAIVSGTHEIGSSHYELLRAFVGDSMLRRISTELESVGYLTHEFGDSVFIEADNVHAPRRMTPRLALAALNVRKVGACVAC